LRLPKVAVEYENDPLLPESAGVTPPPGFVAVAVTVEPLRPNDTLLEFEKTRLDSEAVDPPAANTRFPPPSVSGTNCGI
jgi:hypothetical protein